MGAVTPSTLERAVADEASWARLVRRRRRPLAWFLRWATACEQGAPETSLRVEHRNDIGRCRRVLPLFDEPWWGVVVYSCFDSTTGATAAARQFRAPLCPIRAERALHGVEFPKGSVQHHRRQSTLRGARHALVSACEKADEIRAVMLAPGMTFDDRFTALRRVGVHWWGRTTCFDALLRAGALGVGGHTYRPDKAYLANSTGPAAGFEQIWGVHVTGSTADVCEAVLRRWTHTWDDVAAAVGVEWVGPPYDSADFENALCVFQERPHPGLPEPVGFRTKC